MVMSTKKNENKTFFIMRPAGSFGSMRDEL